MIKNWLNNKYLDKKEIAKLRIEFLKAKPFSHLSLSDFLRKEKLVQVVQALSKETFEKKESDLFSLNQTLDFKATKNKVLIEFRNFLASKEFSNFLEEVTGEKTNCSIDCNGSIYLKNDYLLAHDDRLESRKIAFIFYLTSLSKKDGGSLDLFKCVKNKPVSVQKSILPKANSFVFFKVTNNSFHQVSEVVSDKERVSINGWLHND